MSINRYLAMTAAEFSSVEQLPKQIAWMACHFSCYGAGITNLPRELPVNSIIILNDRTPIHGHDPKEIAKQLSNLADIYSVSAFLLDFQRPNNEQTHTLVKHLVNALPLPVGVTDYYAKGINCPVFLPPPPLDTTLSGYLSPWNGREIWLEIAEDSQIITVTKTENSMSPLLDNNLCEPFFTEEDLFCNYHIETYDDRACITLHRGESMLKKMLNAAEKMGVTTAIGLYQELKDWNIS